MDPQILEFLKASNLLSTQHIFEDYDFDTFAKLEPHHLRELLVTPRERILFEIKHGEFIKNHSEGCKLLVSARNASPSFQKESAVPVDDNEVYVEMTEKQDLIINDVQFKVLNETFVLTESQTLDRGEDDDFLRNDKLDVAGIESVAGPSSSLTPNKLPTTFSTFSESEVFNEIRDFDMEIIYAKHAKNGSLEPVDRGKISRCVIKFLLSRSDTKTITRAQFLEAAGTIAATFAGENEGSYYIPSEADEAASGRLYQTYKSMRTELAEAGIITKRAVRKKKDTPSEKVAEIGVENTKETVIDVAASMEYLASHTDNKNEILQHWANSRSERFHLIGRTSVPDYVRKFPILSMADGYEWLSLDFEQQYPASKNAMNKWIDFMPKLLSYASQKAKRNANIRDIINAYDKSDASQLLLSFKILPWILRNPMKSTNKKKVNNSNAKGKSTAKENPKRPSQLEISDNFIPHFNTENDDTRSEGGFIEVKLIGSNTKYHTYVYIDNVQYLFADISSGIDCAFKLYYVFNLVFPEVSAHVWEFLNLAIYHININNTKSTQAPNLEVLADIQRQST